MEQFFYVLSALAAGVWSVWTWSKSQEEERQVKRDQKAALFVNSFIVVTEELQSRLHKILEEDELAFYKKEYQGQYEYGSPAAMEILYLLCQYFGWAYRIFRYGPYTNDPRVIELTRKIGKAWESRSFPGDAFRFTLEERIALGEAVVRRIGEVTAILPLFESIPLYQFEEEISNKQNKQARLYQSRAVLCTLEAIDRADRVETLEGHERLPVLQNLLVDLLTYLESVEGFQVSVGKRRKVTPRGIEAQMASRQSTIVRIIHETRGRIRLGIHCLKTDMAYANRLQSLLGSVTKITSIRISTATASVIICYTPDMPEAEFARMIVNTIVKGLPVD